MYYAAPKETWGVNDDVQRVEDVLRLFRLSPSPASRGLIPIWRSNGTEFERLQSVPPAVLGGKDADLAVGPDGTVYFIDLNDGCFSLSGGRPEELAWWSNPLACHWSETKVGDRVQTFSSIDSASVVYDLRPLGAADRPWIDIDANGSVWIAWTLKSEKVAVYRFDVLRIDPERLEGHGNASATTPAFRVGAKASFTTPCPWTGPPVTHGPYVYVTSCTASGPVVFVSDDRGGSWTNVSIGGAQPKDAAAACPACHVFVVGDTDDSGNVYVVWSEPDPNGGHRVVLSRSIDGARSWSAPRRVNGADGTHVMPWVAGGAVGEVAVVWYGTTDRAEPENATGSWFVHAAWSDHALASDPQFLESAAFVDGLGHPMSVKSGGVCVNPMASCGNDLNGEKRRALGDFLEAAIDREGTIHVAFVDATEATTQRNAFLMYASSAARPPKP